MDEQLLRRVADTRALRLRVDDDPLRRVQIGRGVYEHVAVPGGRVDHGYRRDALQRVLQALSAARMMRSTTPACVASSASSSRPPPATSTIAPAGTPAASEAAAATSAWTAFAASADAQP